MWMVGSWVEDWLTTYEVIPEEPDTPPSAELTERDKVNGVLLVLSGILLMRAKICVGTLGTSCGTLPPVSRAFELSTIWIKFCQFAPVRLAVAITSTGRFAPEVNVNGKSAMAF